MLPITFHSDVPALMAQPRLFLGPEIPGFLSANDTVVLPLTLDGRMTDTGIPDGHLKDLKDYLGSRQDRFVCASPIFHIYPSRARFESAVRPAWLADVARLVEEDLELYQSVYPEHMLQTFAVSAVMSHMQVLEPLFSACLYLGNQGTEEGENYLYAHDLALYGHPVNVRSQNLFPLLNLLETFFLARERMRSGMAETILVQHPHQTLRHFPRLEAAHGPFVEFVLREGAILCLPREDLIPVTELEADPDGNVDPVRPLSQTVQPAYLVMQHEALVRASVFLGFFLLVHYEIDGSLMEAFLHRLETETRRPCGTTPEHLQFVLEAEMYELGYDLSREGKSFEGRCLLRALQALSRIA